MRRKSPIENEFYFRAKGDIKPYNDPVELLRDVSENLPWDNISGNRLEELLGELATLGLTYRNKPVTAAEYHLYHDDVFYLAVKGDMRPYNTLVELTQAVKEEDTGFDSES